ncbi:MAG: pyrroloquinoline quinone biosynthesis protein PqqE [Treponema sp. CETP13]|nr:MAG: pyrroloquinoline quinone biosynthesis protein PqqE [Treponema sp. CETP13]
MGLKDFTVKTTLNAVLNKAFKSIEEDPAEGLCKIAQEMSEKLTKVNFGGENSPIPKLEELLSDKNSKWPAFAASIVKDVDHNILKGFVTDLGYEAGYKGNIKRHELMEKEQCNIPWAILFDPTTACNLRCTGCWSAEYGHKYNLTYAEMDNIVKQGEEIGTHFYLMTGGEPTVRMDDVLKLAAAHPTSEFHLFTNGTLIDEKLCDKVLKVGNISFSLSLEGFEEVNDSRRGKGTYNKVMKAMDIMKSKGILFGTSICYTSANYKVVTSDAFIDMIIDKGVKYSWFFHYMPVGNNAVPELMPSPEEREYVLNRVRYLRSGACDKLIFTIDFQNDAPYIQGCVAGGRNYLHINAKGDVEPCVFIHYSNCNIKNVSLLEALKSPIFMAYHKNQPFNSNYLKPCPMLENPQSIKKMVDETGAISTDYSSPESVDHLVSKTIPYAKAWDKKANKIWSEMEKGTWKVTDVANQ